MALAYKKPICCILQFRASPFQQPPRSLPFICPRPSKYDGQTCTQLDPLCSLTLDPLNGTVSVSAHQSMRCEPVHSTLKKNKCHPFWSFFYHASTSGRQLQLASDCNFSFLNDFFHALVPRLNLGVNHHVVKGFQPLHDSEDPIHRLCQRIKNRTTLKESAMENGLGYSKCLSSLASKALSLSCHLLHHSD